MIESPSINGNDTTDAPGYDTSVVKPKPPNTTNETTTDHIPLERKRIPNPKKDTLRKYALYDKYKAILKNKKQAAIKAGFAESTAIAAKANIEQSATYQAYRHDLSQSINDLMPATQMARHIVDKIQNGGKQVSTKSGHIVFLKDDGISHKYLDTAAKLVAPEKKPAQQKNTLNMNFNTLVDYANS